MTIVSTATYGLGAALAVGGAAYGAARVGLLPRWWSLVSSVGTAVAAVALVSYADSGLFSPDVQQQTVAGLLQLWLLLTAAALVSKAPASVVDRRRSDARPRFVPLGEIVDTHLGRRRPAHATR